MFVDHVVNQLESEIIQSQIHKRSMCQYPQSVIVKKSVLLYKGVTEMASVGHQIHYSKTYSWDITFVPRKENQSEISLKNQKGTLLLNCIKMKENAHNPFWFAGMVI